MDHTEFRSYTVCVLCFLAFSLLDLDLDVNQAKAVPIQALHRSGAGVCTLTHVIFHQTFCAQYQPRQYLLLIRLEVYRRTQHARYGSTTTQTRTIAFAIICVAYDGVVVCQEMVGLYHESNHNDLASTSLVHSCVTKPISDYLCVCLHLPSHTQSAQAAGTQPPNLKAPPAGGGTV